MYPIAVASGFLYTQIVLPRYTSPQECSQGSKWAQDTGSGRSYTELLVSYALVSFYVEKRAEPANILYFTISLILVCAT